MQIYCKNTRSNFTIACLFMSVFFHLNVKVEASEPEPLTLKNEAYSLQVLQQQMSSLEAPLLKSTRASEQESNSSRLSLGDDNFFFEKKVGLAKRHLLVGDAFRALEIVEPLLDATLLPKHSSYFDALKVQFEASRILKKILTLSKIVFV